MVVGSCGGTIWARSASMPSSWRRPASPQTARYIPNPLPRLAYATPPHGWKETMRYRAPGDLTQPQAQGWFNESKRVYQATIAAMRKDGVIR